MTISGYDNWKLMTPDEDQALKPTIKDGEWAWLPVPKQDKAWRERVAKRDGK